MKKLIGIHLVAACIAAAAIAGCSKAGFSIDGPGGYYDSEKAPAAPSGDFYDIGGEGREGREGNMHDPFVSGVVTAAEWNDLANWSFWASLLNGQEWTTHSSYWNYFPYNYVYVKVVDDNDAPVCGAKVVLEQQGSKVWSAVSDNSGAAVLWASLYESSFKQDASAFTLKIDGKSYDDFVFTTPSSSEVVVNKYVLRTRASNNAIDVAFIVDATGSMGDEIGFLKKDLEDIIKLVAQQCTATVRTGTVFYRDQDDEYITKYSQFTTNLRDTRTFIEKQEAMGGGDWPEAVHTALATGIQSLRWDSSARSRVAFLILDAPPHHEEDIISSCQKSIEAYAAAGIKIVPVAASGIDKACEYLLRSFALSTNGTYVFITDDSGVGNDHIEATVGKYQVEKLRDLIARLIIAYAK